MLVMCMVIFHLNLIDRVVKEVPGTAIKSDTEAWLVDFSDYIDHHPEFKEFNDEVKSLNSNDCAIISKE